MPTTQLPCECLHGVSWVLKSVSTEPQMLTLPPSPPLLYEAIWQQKISIMTKEAESGQVPQPGLDGMQPNPGSGKAEQISSVARDLDDIF